MTARGGSRLAMALLLAAMPALPVMAGSEAEPAVASVQAAAAAGVAGPAAGGPTVRNGQEIYRRFLDGLADQDCSDDASTRWRSHFGHVPRQLASRSNDVLPLFGYVVEALRRAYRDRGLLGDPDFVKNPVEQLLSPGHLAVLAGSIEPERA